MNQTLFNSKLPKIVTIDGPAGAGKSTLARELAARLAWNYLDTGAIYRAMAFTAFRRGCDPREREATEELVRSIDLSAIPKPEGLAVLVDGEDVTAFLRSPEVSRAASIISAWPGVRAALLGLQRALGGRGKVVAEGRDMGTVVFPEAGLKFFLHATPEIRAKRRFTELQARGVEVTRESVLIDLLDRDEADSSRPVAPLKPALGAIIIDSTNLGVEDVLKVMYNAFKNKFLPGAASGLLFS